MRILIVEIVPAIVAVAIALGVAGLIGRQFGLPLAQGRFQTIDGLRGYLAFMVFLHHASVWYLFVRAGEWEQPSSSLYRYFGGGSVDIFFMITAFLFWSKLIENRSHKISWLRLYVSRVLRLFPMYLAAVVLMLMLVGFATGFQLKEPPSHLIRNIIPWVTFTAFGAPDINGFVGTKNVVAGVMWSLPYEWWFYFSLPVCGLLFATKPPKFWLFLSIVVTSAGIYLVVRHSTTSLLGAFVGGILAAFLVRQKGFCEMVSGPAGSIVCLIFLASAPILFPIPHSLPSIALLSAAFIIIASGNDLFGVLSWPTSRILGEMTYSIYLLHGMIYFVAFHYVIGLARAAEMSLAMHWIAVFSCTPILIIVSYCSFRTIEAPAMAMVRDVTGWIQKKLGPSGERGISRRNE
jgi:peptidoglycan/LPS O-acetylase OafA/YrhL